MRFILTILLLTLLNRPTLAADTQAIADLVSKLDTPDSQAQADIAQQLLDLGPDAHESLWQGPASTAALRASLRAQIREARDKQLAAGGLVVHEWGSIRTLANHKGATIGTQWSDASDLPPFVHLWENPTQPEPQVVEKPILYFYTPTPQPMKLNVQVRAPQGLFTQYYPLPTSIRPTFYGSTPSYGNARLAWAVELNPKTSSLPSVEPNHPWWHIARDVDAAPLVVNNEHEKFLFYRGVTRSEPEIRITGDEAKGIYELHNTSHSTITHAILMRVNEKGGTYCLVRKLARQEKVSVDLNSAQPDFTDAQSAQDHFQEYLQWRGLYPKEATGLTKIWGKMFFAQPGIRLLYVMPDAHAAAMLTLAISPQPAHTARTLIVQVECETVDMRKRIEKLIDDLSDQNFARREAAQRELESLDRFAQTLLREAIKSHTDPEVRQRANEILEKMNRKG